MVDENQGGENNRDENNHHEPDNAPKKKLPASHRETQTPQTVFEP